MALRVFAEFGHAIDVDDYLKMLFDGVSVKRVITIKHTELGELDFINVIMVYEVEDAE
jgi:Cu/Ag efflux protein CusF